MKRNKLNSYEDLSDEFHSHSGDRKKNGSHRSNTNLWVFGEFSFNPTYGPSRFGDRSYLLTAE